MKNKKKKKTRNSNRKLNIVQLHWGFPPIIGGVETHLTIIMPEMVKRGHKVSLITSHVEGCKQRDTYKGVSLYRTPLMDLNWLYKRGLSGIEEEVNRIFSGILNKKKPDIVHVHNMHYFSEPHITVLERYCKKKGIPLILTAHNSWDNLLFLELTRNIKWAHIIAVSHFIKRELIGAGVDDRNITVIHHGIDTKAYHPRIKTDGILKRFPELKGKRIIFHPARMGLGKGCDVSIKAMRIIKERFPDVMLVLAGTKNIIDWGQTQQKDIAYMLSLIKMFDLEKNILVDVYTLDEMAQLYGLAQLCVYPSVVGEPFGLTMLESLASGKPIIVTDSGGMPEIIKDGINGYVIPIKDFEALASKVELLLDNDRLRERLGYTGRQIVEAQYKKEIVTKNTLDIYRWALGRRK